jgi:tetratricopeptide (TPR) repeat protein
MKRLQLRDARLELGWSLGQAAERIGVGKNTLWRWEQGQADPYPYNVRQVCKAYGLSATELGLEGNYLYRETSSGKDAAPCSNSQDIDESVNVFHDYLQDDLELHLLYLIYDWLHCRKSARPLVVFQQRLSQEIESYDQMNEQNYSNHNHIDMGRRDALRRIALFPLQALGFGMLGTTATWARGDILTHCAAGITACDHLSQGDHEDIALAFSTLSAYLPALESIVKDSTLYRQEAAALVAQSYLIKHVLALHIEGSGAATRYGKRAITYAKESGNVSLQVIALRRLSWAYLEDKLPQQALQTSEEARHLIEQNPTRVPPRLRSSIYGTLAVLQAKNGIDPTVAIPLAQEAFFATPTESNDPVLSNMDFNYAQLIRNQGLAYTHRGLFREAIQTYTKAIDPEQYTPKIAMSVTTYTGLVHYQTMAELKNPKREKEHVIDLWKVDIGGAIDLRNEQRFEEACMAYEVIEGIWPGDSRVMELRRLLKHW